MTLNRPIAIFSGSKSQFNVLYDVLNFGWMLHRDVDLHLVTTRPDEFGERIHDYFEIHSYGYPNSSSGELRTLVSYLERNDPRNVVNVVEAPLHATPAAAILGYDGTPFTYRYSSDLFDLYRVTRGWRQVAHVGPNNALGRVPLAVADRCIALGPRGKKRLVDRGKDPSDVVILPPPVDAERFRQETDPPDWDVPADRSVVLFAGRRTRIKGMDDMEIAIPEILERRDDLQFVFVGSHGRTPEVPAKYEDHVTMVGRVPLGGMPKYFRAADLLVLPTYNEGLPRVVLESLASGTPVVARDVADVAYATKNTFDEIQEFIDMVVGFESLPLDEVTPFTRETLKPKYVEFFESL